MKITSLLLLYMLLALLGGLLLLLADKLWFSNHNWHLSRTKLLTCRKCGNVFQLPASPSTADAPFAAAAPSPSRCPTRAFTKPSSSAPGT